MKRMGWVKREEDTTSSSEDEEKMRFPAPAIFAIRVIPSRYSKADWKEQP